MNSRKNFFSLLLIATAVPAHGQIWSYEGFSLPDDEGWERLGTLDCDRWVDDEGWFTQEIEVGNHGGGPYDGEWDFYRKSIASFFGVETFFVEWVVVTDGPREDIIGVAPAVVTVAGNCNALYHFTIASDQVRLIRDTELPYVFVEIESEMPHRYRVELFGVELFLWFVDDELVASGRPEAYYPCPTARLGFAGTYYLHEHLTHWDYVRFGPIPIDASLDFDSDGLISWYDHFLFTDYLSGPSAPHARGWSVGDADQDSDIDLHDFAALQDAFTG